MTEKRRKELEQLAQSRVYSLLHPIGKTHEGRLVLSDELSKEITIGCYTTPFAKPVLRGESTENCAPEPPQTAEEKDLYSQFIIEGLKSEAMAARIALAETAISFFEEDEIAMPKLFVTLQGGSGFLEDYSILPKMAKIMHGMMTAKQKEELKRVLSEQIAPAKEAIVEAIGDKNRQRGERWATVPECIRAVIDMVKLEREDGKNIPLPGSYDTLRIKVSEYLKKNGKRRRGSNAKPYYQTADIADAVANFYKVFEPVQYLREFKNIGIPGDDITDTAPNKAEQAK